MQGRHGNIDWGCLYDGTPVEHRFPIVVEAHVYDERGMPGSWLASVSANNPIDHEIRSLLTINLRRKGAKVLKCDQLYGEEGTYGTLLSDCIDIGRLSGHDMIQSEQRFIMDVIPHYDAIVLSLGAHITNEMMFRAAECRTLLVSGGFLTWCPEQSAHQLPSGWYPTLTGLSHVGYKSPTRLITNTIVEDNEQWCRHALLDKTGRVIYEIPRHHYRDPIDESYYSDCPPIFV